MNRLIILFCMISVSICALDAKDPDAPDPREKAPEKPLVEKIEFTPPMVRSAAGPDKSFLEKMHGVKKEEKKTEEDYPLIDLKVGASDGMGSVSNTPESEMMYVNKKFGLQTEAYHGCRDIVTTVFPTYHVKVLYIVDDHGGSHGGDEFWIKVRTEEGKEGFILNKYLQKERPLIVFAPPSPSTIEPKKMYVTASSLYLRDEPNRYAYSYIQIPQKGELLLHKYGDKDDYIDGRVAKWAYVEYRHPGSGYTYRGWVYSAYISSSRHEQEGTLKEEDPKHIYSGTYKYIKSKILHFRDEPSKFGAIIATFPHGTRVSIEEREKNPVTIMGIKSIWVKISTGKTSGWVYGGFLSDQRSSYIKHDFIDRPLRYPLTNGRGRVSSPYGIRVHPISKRKHMHSGLDFSIAGGSPILAAGDGRVKMVKDYGRKGYGKLVVLEHPSGLYTYYAHQRVIKVRQGQQVKSGDVIGLVGTTGSSTGNHLHFEVRTGYWKATRNPINYIPVNTTR